MSEEELETVAALEKARPQSLRAFDQIPMRGADLLCQVKFVAHHLAEKHVVFVGDHDGTSLLLGMLSVQGHVKSPASMTLLDFDDRLLVVARALSNQYGFELTTRLYNVFDPPPVDLVNAFDAFYTNPPYGASNEGASARLFITRGCERVHHAGQAFIILPNDRKRAWTQTAMRVTQVFLLDHGWGISTSLGDLHRYHLDDDRNLMSGLIIADRSSTSAPTMPWAGTRVRHTSIPQFYGKSVLPPYPLYISDDGNEIGDLLLPGEDHE